MERLKVLISWLLILAGTVEAVWGLLQIYGFEPSNHSLYALTGSFYNPGPYSGFLAMCVPLALYEWLKGKRIWKHLALAALVLMLVVLPSGMSRSAWLAALVASGYVWVMHYRKMVCPLHTSFAEPHLSLLSVGETVCGASGGLSDGETGMGCKDGAGEGSEGGIYRSS